MLVFLYSLVTLFTYSLFVQEAKFKRVKRLGRLGVRKSASYQGSVRGSGRRGVLGKRDLSFASSSLALAPLAPLALAATAAPASSFPETLVFLLLLTSCLYLIWDWPWGFQSFTILG